MQTRHIAARLSALGFTDPIKFESAFNFGLKIRQVKIGNKGIKNFVHRVFFVNLFTWLTASLLSITLGLARLGTWKLLAFPHAAAFTHPLRRMSKTELGLFKRGDFNTYFPAAFRGNNFFISDQIVQALHQILVD